MAEIAGFRGLLYDPSRVEMDSVLAPPYDVIDDAGREQLAKHDKNCVRIILPKVDEPGDAKYQHAHDLMTQWSEQGIFVRDARPAIYRYHQVYQHAELGEAPVTRRGFIAAVRLHDFDEHVILRHERTLKGPKIDRLKLWEATSAHLSQIFTLYSDPSSAIDANFASAESAPADLDGTTEDGTRHLLWRVSDPKVIAKVSEQMADKNLYIADGHHRYETMLALRDRKLAANPSAAPRSSVRFGMMFLANIDDPGLVVLPTHRMIHSLAELDVSALRTRLQVYFDLRDVEGALDQAALVRKELAEAAKRGPSFGMMVPGHSGMCILTLKADADLGKAGLTGSKETLALDVTLLHELVLDRGLGITREHQEAQTNIEYFKDTQKALDARAKGQGQLLFLMNATLVSQVVAVYDADEVMPQKSTFFYPKIASGMVFNPIAVDEIL